MFNNIKTYSKKRKIILAVLAVLTVVWLGFIWGNSMASKSESADTSQGLFAVLQPALNFVFYPIFGDAGSTHAFFRKLAHFGEFAVLGTLIVCLLYVLKNKHLQHIINVFSFGLIAAVIDESIQILSNRGPAVLDVLIDFSGFSTAAGLILLFETVISRLWKRKKEKK